MGHIIYLKVVFTRLSDTCKEEGEVVKTSQKISIFNVFGEANLCLLNRFFFLKYLETILFSFYLKEAWKNIGSYFVENLYLAGGKSTSGYEIVC